MIAVCAFLLPIAAAFQIFDGTQVVGCGILRGMGRTRAPALVTLVGYYAIALPFAWWLGLERGLGLAGHLVGPLPRAGRRRLGAARLGATERQRRARARRLKRARGERGRLPSRAGYQKRITTSAVRRPPKMSPS